MKQFAFWFVLIALLATAASFAIMHFEQAFAAVQQFVQPGPLSPRHAYLSERCAACHEPTVGVTVAKCTACHADNERLLASQPTAFHASIKDCAACHIEHQGANVRPLVMDHVALAKIGARTLARSSQQDADSAATLASLQTWLRVRNPEQLDAGTSREVLDCAGCHERKDPHLQRFGRDCAQCHKIETWDISDFRHPSSHSRECVQCHQPPPSHVRGHGRADECFECHNTADWMDIENTGLNSHH